MRVAFDRAHLVDRVGALRKSADLVAALEGLVARSVVVGERLQVATRENEWLLSGATPAVLLESGAFLLGRTRDEAFFAVDARSEEGSRKLLPLFGSPLEWSELRTLVLGGAVGDRGNLLAQARSLVDWHEKHRFCGRCGQPTVVREFGSKRRCGDEACGMRLYPQTDPVPLVLVVWRDQCLLARGTKHPPGLYACLAGFLEPGESLESGLIREVTEEVALDLGADGVRLEYVVSQPWPFAPSSSNCTGELITGWIAHLPDSLAAPPALTLDPTEITDTQWVTRADVAKIVQGTSHGPIVRVPVKGAVSRAIIDKWAKL